MMQRIVTFMVAALVMSSFLFSSASAGLKEPVHKGFYISLGLGGGSLGVDFEETNITFDRESGLAGNFRIGWALSQKFLLGIEGNVWTKDVDTDVQGVEAALTFSNTSAAITFYPADYIYLKAGPSVGHASVDYSSDNANLSIKSDDGIGGMIGAGAELRITRLFSIMPSIQWTFQKLEGFDQKNFNSNVFSFTLGGGFHW